MIGNFFGHNLEILPISQAQISLDDIHFTYGYGVYETLKVRKGKLYFALKHLERLVESARLLEIGHQFSSLESIKAHIEALISANSIENANIKILLIGTESEMANLYIICLAPLFPPRENYKKGVSTTLFEGERFIPQAKSLNMLMSAMAYKKAQEQACYDALLLDRAGNLREGTRTNLFYIYNGQFCTPPSHEVLLGVTRSTIFECFPDIVERSLSWDEVQKGQVKQVFLSSTSTKIIPVKKIESTELIVDEISANIVKTYSNWLDDYSKAL